MDVERGVLDLDAARAADLGVRHALSDRVQNGDVAELAIR